MSKNKNKPHGHYCRICGQYKANEKFSGKGHNVHICKLCHAMPVAKRNEQENIKKIDGIQSNFFISKENIKRLKKYASDSRYPQSSQYAKKALEAFQNRMDEYNGKIDMKNATQTVSYIELDSDLKAEVSQGIDELITLFLDTNDYLPTIDDLQEILEEVCKEISEALNFEINGMETEGYLDYNVSAPTYVEDDEEDDCYAENEVGEIELLIDDTLWNVVGETLEKTLAEFKEDGIEFPTYLDTLVLAETDRLKVRFLTESDYHNLHDIMKKPEVMYAWEHGFNKGETKKWLKNQLKRYKKDGYGYFAVISKETNKLVGQTGLMKSEINGKEVVELGYIFDNLAWGQGFCIEAVKAAITLATSKFCIDKLYCTIRPENEASVKVAEKLGMKNIGEYIKVYNEKDMVHSIYLLEL